MQVVLEIPFKGQTCIAVNKKALSNSTRLFLYKSWLMPVDFNYA
jgi:hypothetical protein